MLRQQVYVRTFGNLRIKVWAYPEQLLKSFLIGLKRNSNTTHRTVDMVGFKHYIEQFYKQCNCSDKIEDICLKLSVETHRFDKIYLPIEVMDTDAQGHKKCRVFIGELKSLDVDCTNDKDCKIDIIRDNVGTVNCLLKLKFNNKVKYVDKFVSTSMLKEIKTSYKKVIYDLLNGSNEKMSTSALIALFIKYNMPYDEILNLHKDLQQMSKKENENNASPDLISKQQNEANFGVSSDWKHCLCQGLTNHNRQSRSLSPPAYKCSESKLRRYKICRSPTNLHRDMDNRCKKLSPETCSECDDDDDDVEDDDDGNSSCGCQHSKVAVYDDMSDCRLKRDVEEIKCALRYLLKAFHIDDKSESDENNKDCMIEILKDIKHKFEKLLAKDYYKHKKEPSRTQKVDSCQVSRNKIYDHLPSHIPVLDANQQPQDMLEIECPSNKPGIIQTILENVGVSKELSAKIGQLTPESDVKGCVTNVYYYVGGVDKTAELTGANLNQDKLDWSVKDYRPINKERVSGSKSSQSKLDLPVKERLSGSSLSQNKLDLSVKERLSGSSLKQEKLDVSIEQHYPAGKMQDNEQFSHITVDLSKDDEVINQNKASYSPTVSITAPKEPPYNWIPDVDCMPKKHYVQLNNCHHRHNCHQ